METGLAVKTDQALKLGAIRTDVDLQEKYLAYFEAKWYFTYDVLSIPDSRRLGRDPVTVKGYIHELARKIQDKMAGFGPEVLFKIWDIGTQRYVLDAGQKTPDGFRIFDEPTLYAWIEKYRDEAVRILYPEPKVEPAGLLETPKGMSHDEMKEDLRTGKDLMLKLHTPVYDGLLAEILNSIGGDIRKEVTAEAAKRWKERCENMFQLKPGSLDGMTRKEAEAHIENRQRKAGAIPFSSALPIPSYNYLFREVTLERAKERGLI